MKDIGWDYIDYWQSVRQAELGLRARFGIRVQDGFCSAVNAVDVGRSLAFGRLYQIPVRLEILPNYLRVIIDDHLLNSPNSDLMDVLNGKKSFRDALAASTTEPRRSRESRLRREERSGTGLLRQMPGDAVPGGESF